MYGRETNGVRITRRYGRTNYGQEMRGRKRIASQLYTAIVFGAEPCFMSRHCLGNAGKEKDLEIRRNAKIF